MKIKNLQTDQKIFFIGLNKTATTTFYRFFQKNGYECEDSPMWWRYHTKEEFENNEVFTDGYDKVARHEDGNEMFDCWPNIRFLNQTFPNSYYILQTRPMKDWLISRQLKYAYNTKTGKVGLDSRVHTLEEDYILRLYWHKKVTWEANVLFKNTDKQFLKLDISEQNSTIVTNLEKFLQIKFEDNLIDEHNKTTWVDKEAKKFYENKVTEFLQQKKYEM
tara:strand:+ start:591 stop:1247 length:657 start_codon:yes stop_codon:yes gene_type:complete